MLPETGPIPIRHVDDDDLPATGGRSAPAPAGPIFSLDQITPAIDEDRSFDELLEGTQALDRAEELARSWRPQSRGDHSLPLDLDPGEIHIYAGLAAIVAGVSLAVGLGVGIMIGGLGLIVLGVIITLGQLRAEGAARR